MATGSIVDAKGDIITATADNTPVRKAVGSNGQIIVADSTQSDGLLWTDYWADPINVNPNMLLDQINEGSLYTVNALSVPGPDGWTGNATGAGVFKLRRLADPDNGARYVTEITCTTADASIAASDKYEIYTAIEGYDLAQLAPGTASAGQITIMFQFKSNVTGTYGVALTNGAVNRRYIGTITVADTNVANYSVTLTLDTSGTWLYTNGVGCYIFLTLAAGSDFQGTAGAWTADAKRTTSAQANFMSANTNVAYLGRFHVIPGNVVCAYKPADIQRELAKAQRYYEKSWSQGTAVGTATNTGCLGYQNSNGLGGGAYYRTNVFFSTRKRATPSCAIYSANSGTSGQAYNVDTASDQAAAVDQVGDGVFNFYLNADPGASGRLIRAHYTANSRLS